MIESIILMNAEYWIGFGASNNMPLYFKNTSSYDFVSRFSDQWPRMDELMPKLLQLLILSRNLRESRRIIYYS